MYVLHVISLLTGKIELAMPPHGCYKKPFYVNLVEMEDDENIRRSCISHCKNKYFPYAGVCGFDGEQCGCMTDIPEWTSTCRENDCRGVYETGLDITSPPPPPTTTTTTTSVRSTILSTVTVTSDAVTPSVSMRTISPATSGKEDVSMTAVYATIPALVIVLTVAAVVIVLLWRRKKKRCNTAASNAHSAIVNPSYDELVTDHVGTSRYSNISLPEAEYTEIQLDDQILNSERKGNANYVEPNIKRISNDIDEINHYNAKSENTSNKKSTYAHLNSNINNNMNRQKVGSPYSHIANTNTSEEILKSDSNDTISDILEDDPAYDHAKAGSTNKSPRKEKVDTYSHLHVTSKKQGYGFNYTMNCQDIDLKGNYEEVIHDTPEYFVLEDPGNSDKKSANGEMAVGDYDDGDGLLNHEYFILEKVNS